MAYGVKEKYYTYKTWSQPIKKFKKKVKAKKWVDKHRGKYWKYKVVKIKTKRRRHKSFWSNFF